MAKSPIYGYEYSHALDIGVGAVKHVLVEKGEITNVFREPRLKMLILNKTVQEALSLVKKHYKVKMARIVKV